ncbi:hypothetical protein A2U01_0055301, partial [Trifolium medium]|nr:hypothetical protein [Trifolium medium]
DDHSSNSYNCDWEGTETT